MRSIHLLFVAALLVPGVAAQTVVQTQVAQPAIRSATPAVYVQASLAASLVARQIGTSWEVAVTVSEDEGASWATPIRVDADLTGRPKYVETSGVWIVGDQIFVAWEDDRAGRGRSATDLYFARSDDRGVTWSPEVRIDKGFPLGGNPIRDWKFLVSANGPSVSVYFVFSVRGDAEIDELYFVPSSDAGATFAAPIAVSSASVDVDAFDATLIGGSELDVVWQDDRTGSNQLHHRKTTLGTTSWSAPEVQLSDGLGVVAEEISMARRASRVVVAWQEEWYGTHERLFAATSTSAGASFSAPVGIGGYSQTADDCDTPVCAVSANLFSVAWADDRTGRDEVYVSSTTDGAFWFEVGVSAPSNKGGRYPQFPRSQITNNNFIVWSTFDYPNEIEATYSPSGGLGWVPPTSLSGLLASDTDDAVAAYDAVTGTVVVSYLGESAGSSPTQVADDLWATQLSVQ